MNPRDQTRSQALNAEPRHIAAITFDADQTLWDFHAVMRRALAAISKAMTEEDHLDESLVSIEKLKSSRDAVVSSHQGAPHSLEMVRQESIADILRLAGHTDPTGRASRLTERYMDIRFNDIELYPDVTPVLERLRDRFKLGLLSNGNTFPDRCGLSNTFDGIVLGPEHGIEKPDPLAFQLIADQLGVHPSETRPLRVGLTKHSG